MVETARKNLVLAGVSNAKVQVASSESIPFEDNSFDVVTSNGVLNLSPDKEKSFCEIYRVLKPGGRLQFADMVLKEELPLEDMSAKAWSD
jgi:ubiquinone/menaquinone biosynthesis C-methylase UbiE